MSGAPRSSPARPVPRRLRPARVPVRSFSPTLASALGLGLALGVALLPLGVSAQDSAAAPAAAAAVAPPEDPRVVAQRLQAQFERTRRLNLPQYRGRTFYGRNCPEPVGLNWCYWYDESGEMPLETPNIVEARALLLMHLDSLGDANPGDNWISGQRVRYNVEAGHLDRALAVAKGCRTAGWWCDALEGLVLHEMRRYAEAEQAYERVLAALSPREQCRWRDMTPYLDEDTRRAYIRTQCGTPERAAWEARAWWFARTRYGMAGNDSRTEHFARLTYVEFLREAATAYTRGFDEAEREVLVRFGWARRWARDGEARPPAPEEMPRDPDGRMSPFDPSLRINVIGAEPTPAHRFIPPANVLTSPASSDSTEWAVQKPPVIARYHPKYASRLLMLEHQQGLFRRGDTALVILAYDVRKVPGIALVPLEASITLTPGATPAAVTTVKPDAPAKGVLTAKAPWGPLLMSAEVAADSASTLVRARYGIRPPFAVGARVSLSDLLFYTPYERFPTSVEEVLPHALATQKVRADQPVGVYWEAYNTNPAGERMTISLVVAPDEPDEPGRLGRAARALRLQRGSSTVSVSVEDMSARGARTSPRAVQLDISTLKPGDYRVQLEVDVAGQYVIRAERRITVVR